MFHYLNHYKDLFDKAETIRLELVKLGHYHNIEKIYIEQSLQSFRSGFSSAQTLSTLSRFNGIISWICYERFKIDPEMIAASTARKLCGIKIQRGEKAKQKVLDFVLDNVEGFEVEYTKAGNPKPGSYDRADSWVVATAGLEVWKQKNSTS